MVGGGVLEVGVIRLVVEGSWERSRAIGYKRRKGSLAFMAISKGSIGARLLGSAVSHVLCSTGNKRLMFALTLMTKWGLPYSHEGLRFVT